MPERTFSSKGYRYGFNGKEKDEQGEWGDLTHYDYGFRIYNPGVGRFLSVDPLSPEYPMLTPYQFASNTPIAAADLDGLESDLKITDAGERPRDYALLAPQEVPSNYAADFAIGMVKAVGSFFGFVTQAADINNHGHKLSAEDKLKHYPMVADKTLKDVAVEILAAPVIAVGDFIQDPGDGEKAGVAFASVLPFAKALKVRSGKMIFPEQASRLVKETVAKGLEIIEGTTNNTRGPVLSGVMDAKTGKIYYGENANGPIPNLHPILQKKLDALNQRTGNKGNRPDYTNETPGSHSEISALNDALWARENKYGNVSEAQMGEFVLYNVKLKGNQKGSKSVDRCPDCNELTNGVTTIGHE